jgi:hypothetical protein
MNTPKKPLPKVRPFIEKKTEPLHKNGVDMGGILRIVTMFISLVVLSVSMLGAGILVINILGIGLAGNVEGILVKMIVLGFAFLFGWMVGLVSIRAFGNMFYPFVIRIYAWVVLFAVCILYIVVIQKLYLQEYDALHFWAYLVMLLGGLFVLLCLHLLLEDHDLRPFAIPLLVISVVQICAMILRYVFDTNPNGTKLFGDFLIFFVMVSISSLMLMHVGILTPVRYWISALFDQGSNHNGNGNGNGNGDE